MQREQLVAILIPGNKPHDYRIQGAAGLFALLECKTKKHPHARFPDYLLFTAKFRKMRDEAEHEHTRSFLIVEYLDAYRLCDVAALPEDLPTEQWGRTDRADPQDVQACVAIPVAAFFTICPVENPGN